MTSTARITPDDRSAPARWRQAGARLHTKLAHFLRLAFKAGFDPNQPRASAGQPDGGQWTDVGGSFQVAQNAPRGGGGRGRSSGGGSWSDVTPAQQSGLAISRSQSEAAIARVRSFDRTWNPRPGVFMTPEGEITHNQAVTREANARYVDILLLRAGIGPYAVEGLPGRGPYTRPSPRELRLLKELGDRYGCHQCGARDPGLASGNWVYDQSGSLRPQEFSVRQADFTSMRPLHASTGQFDLADPEISWP